MIYDGSLCFLLTVADITAGKVFWFSIMECVVLAMAGLAQIFFLRRWFGKSNARMA